MKRMKALSLSISVILVLQIDALGKYITDYSISSWFTISIFFDIMKLQFIMSQ